MENCLWSHESLLIPEVKTPHLWDKFCLGDMEANDVVQHEIKHGATWSPLEVTFFPETETMEAPFEISLSGIYIALLHSGKVVTFAGLFTTVAYV